MTVLPLDLPEASLVPVVRGLVSEEDRVRAVVREAKVDSVALSVAPEELDALGSTPRAPWNPSSLQERIYADALRPFGPVAMPPPCFVAAVWAARERGLEIVALDLEEEAFTDLYLREVGALDLLWHDRRLRRLARDGLEAGNPQDLLLALDDRIAHPPSYRRVETARERHMARALVERCRAGRRPLALVEVERFPGVARRFQELLPPSGEPREHGLRQ